jgi:Histidine kinase-, DNA gyrase B-, and HSP90-like ATPase
MKLELGLDVLRSYKRLPYKPWHALAEFVDNSTQSYFNNKAALDKLYEEEGASLEVSIVYEKDGDGLMRITDNAMGMSRDELVHAMHIGLPPAYADGRSRYGLGMKMAACWFGDNWKIVTKKLGETTEYTVTIDVKKASAGDDDLRESTVENLSPGLHYTTIEITHLNHRPAGRTIGKIRQFLAGMYRLDIQNKQLVLQWQNSPLDASVDWQFLKNALGEPYEKKFDFEVNGKKAWGWVGILDNGGRPKAGFAIVHKGRMVQTWPEAWHPESLYGQTQGSNDLVNQRLVGEIHLDEFDVSHTKDDIHWVDDEEDQVQNELKRVCAEYRAVAKQSKKSRLHKQAAIDAAAAALQKELNSPELGDLIDETPPPPAATAADDGLLVGETDTSTVDFKTAFLHAGKLVHVLGKLDSTKSPNDPYVVSEATRDDRVIVVINMAHPHLSTVDENGLLNYFRDCMYDGLAEWRARNQLATVEPSTIRRLKDKFLRLSFDIELNAPEEELYASEEDGTGEETEEDSTEEQ